MDEASMGCIIASIKETEKSIAHINKMLKNVGLIGIAGIAIAIVKQNKKIDILVKEIEELKKVKGE